MTSFSRLSLHQHTQLEQLLTELPSEEMIRNLVSTFFEEANWYFCVLEQHYFNHSLRNWSFVYSRTGGLRLRDCDTSDVLYFPALLFQILAMALQFVDPNQKRYHELARLACPTFDDRSTIYSNAGESVMTLLGRRSKDSTVAIEADIMRCAWLKNSGSGTDSFYALGNAIRQAQDASLHLEPLNEPHLYTTNPIELSILWRNEHRRRIWACLFTWESHMALQLGRPRTINAADCTVRPPLDTDIPDHPSRTLFVGTQDIEEEIPSHFTAQLIKYELACKIHRLMSLGAFDPTYTDYNTILTVHAEAEALLLTLPPALRMAEDATADRRWDLQHPTIIRHRLHIPIIVNSFLLALHRTHLQSQPTSLEASLTAARKVLDLSQTLFDITAKHQHKTYTLVFYTIDAGLLLTVTVLYRCRNSAEALPLKDWDGICSTLLQATARMRVLKERNSVASAGEDVLQRCYETVIQTRDMSSVSDPSPNERLSQDADHQYQSVDTSLSGSTAMEAATDFNVPLESFFNHEMLNDFMNDSAFTANWLSQYTEIEYSDQSMMDVPDQIGTLTHSWCMPP